MCSISWSSVLLCETLLWKVFYCDRWAHIILMNLITWIISIICISGSWYLHVLLCRLLRSVGLLCTGIKGIWNKSYHDPIYPRLDLNILNTPVNNLIWISQWLKTVNLSHDLFWQIFVLPHISNWVNSFISASHDLVAIILTLRKRLSHFVRFCDHTFSFMKLIFCSIFQLG